jgi:hypothetical protein
VRNPGLRLWLYAAVTSGVLTLLIELSVRHHVSNKLSTQVAAGVLVWLLLTVAGGLATLWTQGHRPTQRSPIVLSLAVSLDLWVPVSVYRRHPSTRPIGARVIGALLLALLGAALIWVTLWAATWLIQRARPEGVRRQESLCSWATSLMIAGAFSVILALNASGFDARHVVLLVCLSVFVWLAIALALRVLIARLWSLRGRDRLPGVST